MANSAIGICRGSESVGQDSYNDSKNLKVLEVQEGKWEIIRRKMTRRLLEEQDKILKSYFAQKYDRELSRRTNGTHNGAGREGTYWPRCVRVIQC